MSFLYIDMNQVVEILPSVKEVLAYYYVANIMAADDLAT